MSHPPSKHSPACRPAMISEALYQLPRLNFDYDNLTSFCASDSCATRKCNINRFARHTMYNPNPTAMRKCNRTGIARILYIQNLIVNTSSSYTQCNDMLIDIYRMSYRAPCPRTMARPSAPRKKPTRSSTFPLFQVQSTYWTSSSTCAPPMQFHSDPNFPPFDRILPALPYASCSRMKRRVLINLAPRLESVTLFEAKKVEMSPYQAS